jgi:hypothetical protein
MTKHFEITRSGTNRLLQLIYPAGMFENLPFEVRLHAPWMGCETVDWDALRPKQRVEIASQGYAIVLAASAISQTTSAAA